MRLVLCGLFFLTLLPQIVLAEVIYNLNQIKVYHGDKTIYDLSDKPFTGRLEFDIGEKIPREKVVSVFQGVRQNLSSLYKTRISVGYQNGLKEGKWYRYEDDILVEELEFKNGLLNGTSIWYDRVKIGEIDEKTEYRNHICMKTIDYWNGKPKDGTKLKNDIKQKLLTTGINGGQYPIDCTKKNSDLLEYYPTGEVRIEKDWQAKITKWYFKNGLVSARSQPALGQNADKLFIAYYENKKPFLILLIKEKKALGGIYYDKAGQKTTLDEQTATDYLLDYALSYVIERE